MLRTERGSSLPWFTFCSLVFGTQLCPQKMCECKNVGFLIVIFLPIIIAIAFSGVLVFGANFLFRENHHCSIVRQEHHKIPKCTILQCTSIVYCAAATIACNDTKLENNGTCCFENMPCYYSCTSEAIHVATVTVWNNNTQQLHGEQKLCTSGACMAKWLQNVAHDPCCILPYHVPWLRIFISIVAIIVLTCIGLLICPL